MCYVHLCCYYNCNNILVFHSDISNFEMASVNVCCKLNETRCSTFSDPQLESLFLLKCPVIIANQKICIFPVVGIDQCTGIHLKVQTTYLST